LTDVAILGPSDRRRIWSAEEKAALLAEIDAEGGKVRLVAQRHRISESLLYNLNFFLARDIDNAERLRTGDA
jgi:hypothetical protein